jgi:hypothetical protein
MTARPTFGRRISGPTSEQRNARAAAIGFYGLFAASITAALNVSSGGLSVLLVVLAFVSLFAGMAAAGEA